MWLSRRQAVLATQHWISDSQVIRSVLDLSVRMLITVPKKHREMEIMGTMSTCTIAGKQPDSNRPARRSNFCPCSPSRVSRRRVGSLEMSHNGPVGEVSNSDFVHQRLNPAGFVPITWIFTIPFTIPIRTSNGSLLAQFFWVSASERYAFAPFCHCIGHVLLVMKFLAWVGVQLEVWTGWWLPVKHHAASSPPMLFKVSFQSLAVQLKPKTH